MLTKEVWENYVFDSFWRFDAFDVCIACFVSIISIPLDILTFPIQIIALIIYKIIKWSTNR